MQNNSGNRLNGIVMEIGDEAVKMDFNHPLAGDILYFKGEVAEIRNATEEEINHGHVHQGGRHPCGGGETNPGDENCSCGK